MTAREALLRIALRAIREGRCEGVAKEDVETFLQQLEADSPHLLTDDPEASKA